MEKRTKTMTEEQRTLLKEHFADTCTAVLAEQLGVSYRTVCRMAVDLGLKKDKKFMATASAIAATKWKELRKGRSPRVFSILNEDKKAYMRQHFATTPNTALAKDLGVNDRTIRRWASRLGLTKDREVMEQCRRSVQARNRLKRQGAL